MVKEYNKSMGSVDRNDTLISLYRVDIQTRKRWYLKINTHLVNICNGWLLYRRYSELLQLPKKNKQSATVYEGCSRCFIVCWVGARQNNLRKTKKRTSSPTRTSKQKLMVPKPAVDIRYDGIRHWPKFGDKCNIGRVCSMLSCSKCQIYFAYKRRETVSSNFMIDNSCW